MTHIIEAIRDWAETELPKIVEHYEKSAPTVSRHVDDLYRRLNNRGEATVREVTAVADLLVEDVFIQPNYAANKIYKLRHELGMDTTGYAGF